MSIYLDNSATTRVRQEVIDEMMPVMSECYGNASSIHKEGREAAKTLLKARERVARLFNSAADEVYFSPCGTHGNNVAIMGRARFVEANDLGRHLITSAIEHPSVMGPCQYLESRGWKVTYLPVKKDGIVNADLLLKSISHETSIITVMWANNEIGSVQPIEELAQAAADRGIYFHTDAVQVPGRLPIDVSRVKVSSLSISGHKFNAPKGVGALFLRSATNLMPTVFGGGQEKGLLPGTEAIPGIVGLGKAAELAVDELDDNSRRLRAMQQLIMSKLTAIEGVKVSGPESISCRLPGHVSLTVSGTEGESLVMKADLEGVRLSSGSACHKGIIEPSHVLRALCLPDREARGSLRISAHYFNTIEECERAAEIIAGIIRSSLKTVTSAKSMSA